jgi:hypothetical protein
VFVAADLFDRIKFSSVDSGTIIDPISEPIVDSGDELFSGMEADPPPSDMTDFGKPTKKVRPKAGPRGGTARLRKEAAAEIETYIQMVALPLSVRDGHCAGALSAQSAEIANALVNVLSRYPGVLEKLRGTGVFGDCLGLAMALKPVAEAIVAHHITKTTEISDDSAPSVNPDAYPAWNPNGTQKGSVGLSRTRVFQSMGPTPGQDST